MLLNQSRKQPSAIRTAVDAASNDITPQSQNEMNKSSVVIICNVAVAALHLALIEDCCGSRSLVHGGRDVFMIH